MEVQQTSVGPLGATVLENGQTRFVVWAPYAKQVSLYLYEPERIRSMQSLDDGYYELTVSDAPAGTRYAYALDGGQPRPDPVSRRLPDGVHVSSEVISLNYAFTDQQWRGLPLEDYVIYELHVGTFSEEGTFAGVIKHLDKLVELGVTAIELLPLAEVPGQRNWGYDGVQLFCIRDDFGGAEGLMALVDACHAKGLAVIVDVVYNHFGPEGNYIAEFGPYFNPVYSTPWGQAVNLDGPGCDPVRHFFIENALSFFRDYHVDGLRLDAIRSLFDHSAYSFLEELSAKTDTLSNELSRPLILIGETDDNDPRWVASREKHGIGLDAIWTDDLHHALIAYLTGERSGYFVDFGELHQVAKAFADGAVLDGIYAEYRGQRWGRSLKDTPPKHLITFAQNHDQIGNRPLGRRLSCIVDREVYRVAVSTYLLSSYIPMLFMGEEFGETRPFLFFTDFSSDDVSRSVTEGRKHEFYRFGWQFDEDALFDPVSPESKSLSTLNWDLLRTTEGQDIWNMYKHAIALRAVVSANRPHYVEVLNDSGAFWVTLQPSLLMVFVYTKATVTIRSPLTGRCLFDSRRFGMDAPYAPSTVEEGEVLVLTGPVAAVFGS